MASRKVLGGAAIALAAAALWLAFGNQVREAAAPADPVAPPAGSAGLVARLDSTAGRPADESPGALAEPAGVFATSAEGLVEVASPGPGGGTMVDLQGRFQYAAVAVADSDTAAAVCLPAAPDRAAAPRERKEDAR